MDYAKSCQDKFDIIFLDPPYNQGILTEAIPLVAAHMAPGGIILCEHQKGEEVPETAVDFKLCKQYNYGKITVSSYRVPEEEGQEQE